MLLAGDEVGRTQNGNNNAYCQDNEVNWICWGRDGRAEDLLAFARKVIALRNGHPALRYRRFLGRNDFPHNARNLTWLRGDGGLMDDEAWADENARAFGMLIDVPILDNGARDVVLLAFNGHHDLVRFTLPPSPLGGVWRRLIDTNVEGDDAPEVDAGAIYDLTGRSILLFEAASP